MRPLFFGVLLLAGTTTAFPQDTLTLKLDKLMTAYTRTGLFNGSVFISQKGRPLLNKGYGLANAAEHIENTPESQYLSYSITKAITATLVLKLAEENKLSLYEKLSKYYPSFPSGDSITIEHLLTHTSGIYNYNNDFSMPVDSEKAMLDFLQQKKLSFSPGTKWSYCNTGYFLLGFIIEKVSGMTYQAAVTKYIFVPLKMTNSGFDYEKLNTKNKTIGYSVLYPDTVLPAVMYDKRELFSAGGIYTTTADLYKFHQAMQSNTIIGKKLTDKAYTPYRKNYGYGWFIDSISGKRVVSHSGGASGFRSYLARITEDNTCIVLLSNNENTDIAAIEKKILKVLSKQPFILPDPAVISPANILSYTGAYSLRGNMTIYIYSQHGQLFARPSQKNGVLLLPEKENSFYIDETDRHIEFKKAKDGNVDSLVFMEKGSEYSGVRIPATWGLTGSASVNGWDGPDLSLTENSLRSGIWTADQVKLGNGEIKFRFNNDWTLNYGIGIGNNKLSANGENIKIKAGIYSIELNLSDPDRPRFGIKKTG